MNEDSHKERETPDQDTNVMEAATDASESLQEVSQGDQPEGSVQSAVEDDTSTGDADDTDASKNGEEDSAVSPEAAALSEVTEDSQQPVSDTPTPDNEPDTGASLLSDESLEKAYDNSIKAFTEGQIVKGAVVELSRDEVMIDIGFKSEGYIPSSEFEATEDGLPQVHVGEEIDVYIVRREDADGQLILSKKLADQTRVWDEVAEACEQEQTVEGKVVERIKGGLRVDVGSLRAFLPASQIELRPIPNLDKYVGTTLELKIVKLNKRRHNIVLSRRALLEEELVVRKTENSLVVLRSDRPEPGLSRISRLSAHLLIWAALMVSSTKPICRGRRSINLLKSFPSATRLTFSSLVSTSKRKKCH